MLTTWQKLLAASLNKNTYVFKQNVKIIIKKIINSFWSDFESQLRSII